MLWVGPTTVDFYESRGRVLAVAIEGATELAVLLELSGEGQTWLAAKQFRLSDDRGTLSDVTSVPHVARVRCAAPGSSTQVQ